jgi:hypothetical protein
VRPTSAASGPIGATFLSRMPDLAWQPRSLQPRRLQLVGPPNTGDKLQSSNMLRLCQLHPLVRRPRVPMLARSTTLPDLLHSLGSFETDDFLPILGQRFKQR